jgi:hypothetical protein
MLRLKKSFAFAATGTSLEQTIHENGVITIYHLTAPNFTNPVTSTLSVKDVDGNTIWTGSAHNENATYLVASLTVPVDRGYTLVCTISGAAGTGGGTVVANLFVDTRN